VLLITGQKSIFNATTRSLHQAILKHCPDKGKVEFIEVAGVANVLEEKVFLHISNIVNSGESLVKAEHLYSALHGTNHLKELRHGSHRF